MSMKSCILLLGLVVYLSNQVSSLKCYACISGGSSECHNDFHQSKYEKLCTAGTQNLDSAEPGLARAIAQLTSKYYNASDFGDSDSEHACVTVAFHETNGKPKVKGVSRNCIPSVVTCEMLELAAAQNGFTLDICDTCTSDLCNSEIIQ